MKAFKILFGLLFLVSAVLQYNDPDPFRWILVYGLAAAVCLLSAFGFSHRLLELFTIAVILFELIASIPGLSTWFGEGMPDITVAMTEDRPYIEETREFFGALICLAVVMFLYLWHRRERVKDERRGA